MNLPLSVCVNMIGYITMNQFAILVLGVYLASLQDGYLVAAAPEQSIDKKEWNEEKLCENPSQVRNGRMELSRQRLTVDYRCNSGYSLVGDTRLVCKAGTWSGLMPICVGRGCRYLKYLDHGTTTYSYGGGIGTFTCMKGYKLEGAAILACDGGNWNGTLPECVESQSRSGSRDEQHDYGHNSVGDGKHRVSHKKKTHYQRLKDSDYSCINSKTAVLPPKVPHTLASTKWALVNGQPRLYTVYRCVWGYVPGEGGRNLYCRNHEWVGKMPHCIKFEEEEKGPLDLQSDQSIPGDKMSHEEWLKLADYSCIGTVADRRRTPPPDIPDSYRHLRYTLHGGKPHLYAQYHCEKGYSLKDPGQQFLYCQAKTWLGKQPQCVKGLKRTTTSTTSTTTTTKKPSDDLPPSNDLESNLCTVNNGGCQHMCEMDRHGNKRCHCYFGYTLGKDGKHCIVGGRGKRDVENVRPIVLFKQNT